jgi:hypothetical protein
MSKRRPRDGGINAGYPGEGDPPLHLTVFGLNTTRALVLYVRTSTLLTRNSDISKCARSINDQRSAPEDGTRD